MSQFGAKNTPWGRAAAGAQQLNPQIFTGQLGGMGAFVSQATLNSLNAAGLSVGALSGGMIPGVNAAAFASPHQTTFASVGFPAAALGRPQAQANTAALVAQQQQQQQQKSQRAFIGTVTKLQDQYGFVDDEVFFQTSVVRGALPHVNDKVMVEAAYSPNMPFKWNAFRVQLLPNQEPTQIQQAPMPTRNIRDDRWMDKRDIQPPIRRERSPLPSRRASPPIRRSPPRRPSPPIRRRSPSPVTARAFIPSGPLKRERSPRRSPTRDTDQSRSPPRRRQRIAPRYNVNVPKFPLDLKEASTLEIRKRYTNMYVPSDFFHAKLDWSNSFPLNRTFSVDHTVSYHVMHKDVDCLTPSESVLDPPDADYRFSAKVMLLSLPTLQELYNKSLGLQDDGRLKCDDFEPIHPNRLISFLVGLKSKNEVLAIGGPWSASLDGADPENDPRVLIKTAIRTTKSLTGVDLSKCTQWYKFLEVRYRRIDKENTKDDGSWMDATPLAPGGEPRVDTVVVFVPDVWNAVPTKLEFEGLQSLLKKQLESKLSSLESSPAIIKATTTTGSPSFSPSSLDLNKTNPQPASADDVPQAPVIDTHAIDDRNQQPDKAEEGTMGAEEENDDKPTHYSKLDIKSLKIGALRTELEARNIDSKGIKSQLVSKLTKAVNDEREADEKIAQIEQEANNILTEAAAELPIEKVTEEKTDQKTQKDEPKVTPVASEPEKIVDERELKKKREREDKEKRERKKDLEKHLVFSSTNPGIVVYPNKTAKGGKFDCKVMTLSSLMDYRTDDNKEHSFEVALFAESFNEMLLRDGAYNIYKALVAAPDKEDEKKEKKESKKMPKDEKKSVNESKTEDTQDSMTMSETNQDQTNLDVSMNFDETRMNSVDKMDQASSQNDKEKDKTKQSGSKRKSRSRSRDKDDKKSTVVVIKEPGLLFSFSYFDLTQCGYLFDRDVEEILLSLDLYLTRAQIQKLLKKVVVRDTFNYRKLTDTVTAKDGKVTKIELQAIADDDLALGNSSLLPWIRQDSSDNVRKNVSRSKSAVKKDDSGTVVFQGAVVDVGQVLVQLDRLEKEQKALEQRHVSLEKDLKHSKEQKESLERRKKRLEEDLRDYKKRLYDAEKCLKNSQDDTVQLKTSLQRCKEWGESICRAVDKALPKREPSSERSTKSSKSDKQKEIVQKDERNGDESKTEIKQTKEEVSEATGVSEPAVGGAEEPSAEVFAKDEFVVEQNVLADHEGNRTGDISMENN